MGQPLSKEEEESAIKELRGLSLKTRGWLSHHIKNALTPMRMLEDKTVDRGIDHILEDLKKINC